MTKPTPEQRLNLISEQGLCSGCGLCESVAGSASIKVVTTSNGYERPVPSTRLDDHVVDQIYDVCPGLRVDGLPNHSRSSSAPLDRLWGQIYSATLAHASDPMTRYEGSTGGVLTALAQYLLAAGKVEFILHTRASTTVPAHGEAVISNTVEEVLSAAGSRYGPAAPLRQIHAALDREQPFAFIGKPCDIAALRNLARHDPRVDRLVRYFLTLVCGGSMVPSALEQFLQRQSIPPDSISALRYRGQGCPGPTTIMAENTEHEFHYLDFWGEDESAWQLPFRCKVCADGIGESADIAAADSWEGGSPDRIESEHDPGTNAVIARTRKGLDLMQEAVDAGYVTIIKSIGVDELNRFQPHQVRKKIHAFDRHQGMQDAGRLSPKTSGLRIKQLAQQLNSDERIRQRRGTRLRIEQGKADEPTPRASTSQQKGA